MTHAMRPSLSPDVVGHVNTLENWRPPMRQGMYNLLRTEHTCVACGKPLDIITVHPQDYRAVWVRRRHWKGGLCYQCVRLALCGMAIVRHGAHGVSPNVEHEGSDERIEYYRQLNNPGATP